MSFVPRRRKNYIVWKNGRAYYRRAIPAKYRPLFGGKTAWVIQLKSHGDAALEAEAAAYAHQHNEELADHDDLGPEGLQALIEEVKAYQADPALYDPPSVELPPELELRDVEGARVSYFVDPKRRSNWRELPPIFVDGEVRDDLAWSAHSDPADTREAVKAGRIGFTLPEARARVAIAAAKHLAKTAQDDDQRELAELRSYKGERELEAAVRAKDDCTLTELLPRWKAFKKQAPMTFQKHEQYVREFAALHGDLHLSAVTKRHVVDYVEHVMTLTHKGEPLSPTSIAKRLDSVRALLAFAVSRDLITHNPATGVKPPQDKRPKTSRSWKSFTPDEVAKLVDVSTELWASRKERTAIGRGADLTTALQCLIWTGARPEEICQLRRVDIDLKRRSIRITNDETEDEDRAKVTKNAHSIREVPIHPRLLPILESHLRSHSRALLFPTFAPQVRPKDLREAECTGQPVEMRGRYMHPISREWTDHLRAKVAGNDPRKVLYSLRHSWAAESRRAGMPEHVRNALMGHADDNPHAGRYGGDADWLDEKRKHLDVMNCLHGTADAV